MPSCYRFITRLKFIFRRFKWAIVHFSEWSLPVSRVRERKIVTFRNLKFSPPSCKAAMRNFWGKMVGVQTFHLEFQFWKSVAGERRNSQLNLDAPEWESTLISNEWEWPLEGESHLLKLTAMQFKCEFLRSPTGCGYDMGSDELSGTFYAF